MTTDQIRAALADCYNVDADCVLTGTEADEDQGGVYHGDADAWLVYGTMPNTNQTDWFFAGWTDELARELAA
jgi:hypothetical protein